MRAFCSLLLALTLCVTCAAASAETFTLAGFDTEGSGHDWNNNLFFSRMETKTGLTLSLNQFTDEGEYTRFKQGLLTGESLPDGLIKASLSTTETRALYEAGVLLDLAPLLEENAPNLYALLEAHPDWRAAITLPDGAIAALPQLNELPTNNVLWLNTRWLRLLQLEMPTTVEQLTEVLRAFKNADPNRNSKADEVPLTFTGMWDLQFLGSAFGLVANDYSICMDENGVGSVLISDKNRALLTWLHGLWEEELIDHNGFTTPDTMRRVTDSNATIIYGAVFGPSVMNLLPASAVTDFEPLLPLEGNTYRSVFGEVIPGTFAITSACKNPAALLRWVDTLYTEEGLYLAYVGQEGSEYTRLSDGKWYWNDDADTISSTVLTDCTIGEGNTLPGYISRAYQLDYDDESTVNTVRLLAALQDVSVTPCPPVYLTKAEDARLQEVWLPLSTWANNQMAQFVTGDIALTDETWAAFALECERMGLSEVVGLFDHALNR